MECVAFDTVGCKGDGLFRESHRYNFQRDFKIFFSNVSNVATANIKSQFVDSDSLMCRASIYV